MIDKKQGNYDGALSSRDWVIRLNLPEQRIPKNIMINGKQVELHSSDEVAFITQPELQEDAMPFKGAGSRPRSMAGPILELTLHHQNVLESLQISCELK